MKLAQCALPLLAVASISAGVLVPGPSDDRTAQPVDPASAGVGRTPTLPAISGIDGSPVSIPWPGSKATVLALTSPDCPVSKRYGPTLAGLEREYAGKGVRFVLVDAAEGANGTDLRAMATGLGLKGALAVDRTWARALGATTTAETFVFDGRGRVVYRGAVDDQYGIGTALPSPRNRYLADALGAVLAGREPKVAATTAPGCLLGDFEAGAGDTLTFHRTVEPILQRACLPCHHDGGVAPFALDSYEQVKRRGPMIRYVVEDGIMPPWFAAKSGSGPSPWKNDRSLSPEDKAALLAWIDGGMAQGDPAEAKPAPTFPAEWSIGEPDQVFALPRPVSVAASGVMPYVDVEVETGFTEDRWVEAVEVLPSARQVVHHVLVFAVPPGEGRGLDELDGFFAAYVPGTSALVYGDGRAKRIPKGSRLRFQLHYTPDGTATTDRTRIGLVFAKGPVRQEVHTTAVHNLLFSIPPGAERHPVVGRLAVPFDVEILSYLPHMHVRGAGARYELIAPDRSRTTLLDVPRYDFNWQLQYILREPKRVEEGSEIVYTAWYDNSAKNPSNPDPTRRVGWGLQTTDEMHLGYLEYVVPGERPGSGEGDLRRSRRMGAAAVEQAFRRLDRDRDGGVTEAEAGTMWGAVREADTDGDGRITLDEAKARFGR